MAEKVETAKSENAKSDNPAAEPEYTMKAYYSNPGALGTTQDIVFAAFTYFGVVKATIKDAKKIVTEFSQKEVNC